MKYCVYKLNFTAPLHCGRGDGAVALTNNSMTLRADTVFSALCNEAAVSSGTEAAEELIMLCKNNRLAFSDTFPYCGGTLYLPLPLCPLDKDAKFDVSRRKEIKSVKWLPAEEKYFEYFYNYIKSGTMFDTSDITKSFADFRTDVKVCVRGEERVPFDVSMCEFKKDCGLYGIIGYESRTELEDVMMLFKGLGLCGIGGQTSRGMGKFDFSVLDENNKYASFIKNNICTNGSSLMLLTTSLPTESEMTSALEGAYYNLLRRGGFSYSPFGETVKKNTQYYLVSGSVLKNSFKGDVCTVGENGAHTLYRYSKPLFLEVKL